MAHGLESPPYSAMHPALGMPPRMDGWTDEAGILLESYRPPQHG